jgi:spermidine synthase
MHDSGQLLLDTSTNFDHFQVWDQVYDGRKARVLYSGSGNAAQSGIALDGESDLLFDYNQRFFELATSTKPRSLLLIGGGMYTLPTALLNAMSEIDIDVVEIDSGLDAIAEKYFDLIPDNKLHIIHADGSDYLRDTAKSYDLIIVDAYNHLTIPKTFTERPTLKLLSEHVSTNGIVGFNVISAYLGKGSYNLRQVVDEYQLYFNAVDIYPASRALSLWLPQNLLLIAQKGKTQPIEEYLRFPKLMPSPDA